MPPSNAMNLRRLMPAPHVSGDGIVSAQTSRLIGAETRFATACEKPCRCLLMGWSGRAPAPPAVKAGQGRQRQLARGAKGKEHAMSQTAQTAVAVIGIDIGKNSFHIVGHD